MLTRLLHHTRRCGAAAIAIEDLDFTDGTSREKHGRNKRFRRLLSRFPAAKLKARLLSMAAEQNIAVVAVTPAYTPCWGAQHWAETTHHEQSQGFPARCGEHRGRLVDERHDSHAADSARHY